MKKKKLPCVIKFFLNENEKICKRCEASCLRSLILITSSDNLCVASLISNGINPTIKDQISFEVNKSDYELAIINDKLSLNTTFAPVEPKMSLIKVREILWK